MAFKFIWIVISVFPSKEAANARIEGYLINSIVISISSTKTRFYNSITSKVKKRPARYEYSIIVNNK